jgi:glutathione S-transferase
MTVLLYDLVGADESRPFSPHCWKVRVALAHKGLEFRAVPTPYMGIAAIEGNTSTTLPVIRDGAKVIADSFAIALYLDEAYPDRPSLFGGEGGKAMARFVEGWSQTQVHPFIVSAALMEIHDMLAPADRDYFRTSREKRFGRRLEDVPVGREARLDDFRARLEPLRFMLKHQPFIGGHAPLFADYIVFGAFQWARIVSPFRMLAEDDPVAGWFGRCLDLHGGLARGFVAA